MYGLIFNHRCTGCITHLLTQTVKSVLVKLSSVVTFSTFIFQVIGLWRSAPLRVREVSACPVSADNTKMQKTTLPIAENAKAAKVQYSGLYPLNQIPLPVLHWLNISLLSFFVLFPFHNISKWYDGYAMWKETEHRLSLQGRFLQVLHRFRRIRMPQMQTLWIKRKGNPEMWALITKHNQPNSPSLWRKADGLLSFLSQVLLFLSVHRYTREKNRVRMWRQLLQRQQQEVWNLHKVCTHAYTGGVNGEVSRSDETYSRVSGFVHLFHFCYFNKQKRSWRIYTPLSLNHTLYLVETDTRSPVFLIVFFKLTLNLLIIP